MNARIGQIDGQANQTREPESTGLLHLPRKGQAILLPFHTEIKPAFEHVAAGQIELQTWKGLEL